MSKLKTISAAVLVATIIGMGANLLANKLARKVHASGATAPKKLGSIVRLVRDGHTFCSGTVINDHLIITAGHCVVVDTPFGSFVDSELIDIRAEDNQDRGVQAKVYAVNPQMDQALLVGNFNTFEYRPAITDPARLSTVPGAGKTLLVSCGYPLRGDLFCSIGYYQKNYFFMWGVTQILLPGMSGGPTMLEDGTVVGVNVAVIENMSVVSPIYNLYISKPENKK